MGRACRSFSIIFGVVPVAMMLWKPEIAPQAMVMNRYGNTDPVRTGPPPQTNWENAGMRISGATMMMPIASRTIVPIFMYVDR